MRYFITLVGALVTFPAPVHAADVSGAPATSARIVVNAPSKDGSFEIAKDSDWYRVRLVQGGSYAIVGNIGGEFDSAELSLRDANGRILKRRIDQQCCTNGFWYRAPTTGTYFVEHKHRDSEDLPAFHDVGVVNDIPPNTSARTRLQLGKPFEGSINFFKDTDCLGVQLTRGRRYGVTFDDPAWPVEMRVLDPTGKKIVDDTESDVVIEAKRTGVHFVCMVDVAAETGSGYTVEVSQR